MIDRITSLAADEFINVMKNEARDSALKDKVKVIQALEQFNSHNKPFYLSKKWWTVTLTALIPVLNKLTGLGLSTEELLTSIVPGIIYVLGLTHKESKRNEIRDN